jgi:hypothetical protein
MTSHFDEGFALDFALWQRRHSFFVFPLKNEVFTFGFVLWRRLLTLTSYFYKGITLGFVLWWRLNCFFVFPLKNEVFTLDSYFDEGFTPGFILWWRLHAWLWTLTKTSYFDFTLGWRLNCFFIFPMKNESLNLDSYLDEGLTPGGFVLWRRLNYFFVFLWKMKSLPLASYFDQGFMHGFILWWRLHAWLWNLTNDSYFNFTL